jgi:hypothetical protein
MSCDNWGCERPDGASRGRPCDPDQAGQRLGAEELGDASGEACRHARGEGRIGPEARRGSAPNHLSPFGDVRRGGRNFGVHNLGDVRVRQPGRAKASAGITLNHPHNGPARVSLSQWQ